MPELSRQLITALNNPKNALSLIGHRLGSKLSKNFSPLTGYRAFLPEAVNIYPTDRCNLNCAMCFEKLRDPRPEIAPEDWQHIIDTIARFKPRIHLSGGEPLLYTGIRDIISHIKRHHLYCAITTNGTFLEAYGDDIIKHKVNVITVSIDGPREVHDAIRGVPGTFDRIMQGLTFIRKHQTRSGYPCLRINSMINPSNPVAMQEVIRLAINYKAERVQFIHPMFASTQDLTAHRHCLKTMLGRDLNYWQGAQAVAQQNVDTEKIQRVCADLEREKSIHVEIFPHFSPQQMEYYYSMDKRFYRSIKGQCHAMWSTATLLPSGDLESCPDYIVGNCHSVPIKRVWNNPIMFQLRKRIYRKQFFPVCRACCFFYL